MPWSTPTLRNVRSMVRDAVTGQLPGADANVPNSVLRVLSDAMGALCHLALQYLDWLALQLLPDTAEAEWLDRHGHIWLVNADGSTGRKLATLASGEATLSALGGTTVTVPTGTQFAYAGTQVGYQTTADTVVAAYSSTPAPLQALDPGSAGNLDPGTTLGLVSSVPGLVGTAVVVTLDGGTDDETDDELRARILARIQEPPMGGDAQDYVNWALRVPGVTRAWCYPQEMGVGTCTVRFMMDDLRADRGGFPLPDDVETVQTYIDSVRPVTVKDLFVESPIPFPINHRIVYLDPQTQAIRNAITQSLLVEFYARQVPGETWYRAWSDEGIMGAAGVNAYDLVLADTIMPSPGYLPVLGDITYGS